MSVEDGWVLCEGKRGDYCVNCERVAAHDGGDVWINDDRMMCVTCMEDAKEAAAEREEDDE